jgi:aminobenzoyl-glutamate utilization protein B
MREAAELVTRVVDVARGAALMTGTSVEHRFLHGCYDVVPNMAISDVLHENLLSSPAPAYDAADRELAAGLCATTTEDQRKVTMEMLGVDSATASALAKVPIHEGVGYWGKGWTIPASTDVGDVSHIAPTAQINTATWPMGIGSHTWQATAASGSPIGMKGMMYAAQVLAGAGWDLMSRPALLAAARAEFEGALGGERYVCAEDLIAREGSPGS